MNSKILDNVKVATQQFQSFSGTSAASKVTNSTPFSANGAGQSLNGQSTAQGTTKILQFPRDVAGAPGTGNQGHYVMFYINKQEKAKLSFGSPVGKTSQNDLNKSKSESNIPTYIKNLTGQTSAYTKQDASNLYGAQQNDNVKSTASGQESQSYVNQGAAEQRGGGNTLFIERAPTVRLDTAIALYMPPTATYVDNASYTDQEIGFGAKLGVNTYNDIMSGKSATSAMKNFLDTSGSAVSEGLIKTLMGTIGALPGFQGAREAAEMAAGAIIADRMELAFKGIAKRKFQFNFKMIPKSLQEANEIRNIIFAFRSNMLPEFVGGNRAGRKMVVPNTFDIQYMYNGAENQYLQKVSTCVCENVTVSYGGDRYRTFEPNAEGAPPVETQITLNFAELELITRERVFEGY